MILLGISFVAGILTVLAPCILPVLPVIVGGSLTDISEKEKSRKRAITIVIALAVSVIIFTLLLKVSTFFISVPEIFWQWLSGIIIVILGIIMIFPKIWENVGFVNKLNTESNQLFSVGFRKKNFWGNIIMGAALGPVFASCSPTYFIILASVLPANFTLGLVYLIAYAVGLSVSLLIVFFSLSLPHFKFRNVYFSNKEISLALIGSKNKTPNSV